MNKYEKFEKDVVKTVKTIKSYIKHFKNEFIEWKTNIKLAADNFIERYIKFNYKKFLSAAGIILYRIFICILFLLVAGCISFPMIILTMAHPVIMFIYFYILLVGIITSRIMYWRLYSE